MLTNRLELLVSVSRLATGVAVVVDRNVAVNVTSAVLVEYNELVSFAPEDEKPILNAVEVLMALIVAVVIRLCELKSVPFRVGRQIEEV